jgi:hypothetical protein
MRSDLPSLLFLFLCQLLVSLPTQGAEEKGWSVAGELRIRGELLENSYRLVAPASDLIATSRLALALRYRGESLRAVAEIQDSRAWGDESLSPIGTDDVNAAEPIQFWLGRSWALSTAMIEARAGRMTLDFGSRRLLARNRFRNTSNAFQGALLAWQQQDLRLQAFYTLPLQREPTNIQRDALRDNRAALDRAGTAERFAGFTAVLAPSAGSSLDAYLFHNRRRPRSGRPVSAQDLWTAGFRLRHRVAGWRGEWESALQRGDSALRSAPGSPQLRHDAWFLHASIARDLLPGLELALEYDHASGDRDPLDNRNQRFDRLYGARASELGPSGIFGVAIRSNQRSPALRLRWTPQSEHELMFSLRGIALDAPRDALVGSGRRDVSGSSGRDVGLQWELRYLRSARARALSWESGIAVLDPGSFFGSEGVVLNPALAGSTVRYAFSQLSFRF